MHDKDSGLSDLSFLIKPDVPGLGGKVITIVNWVDRMPGNMSWQDYDFGNHAVANYATRKGIEYEEDDPEVDEVLYGKIKEGDQYFGYCVHITELDQQFSIEPDEKPKTFPPFYLAQPLTNRSIMRNDNKTVVSKIVNKYFFYWLLPLIAINVGFVFISKRVNLGEHTGMILFIVSLMICMVPVVIVTWQHFLPIRRRPHRERFARYGFRAKIKDDVELIGGQWCRVLDWVDRTPPYKSWMDYPISDPVIQAYSIRRGQYAETKSSDVNEVVFVWIRDQLMLVHVDEFDEPEPIQAYA